MYTVLLLRLLLSSLLLTFLVCIILIVKKLLSKHITTRDQYYLWFSTLILLIVPFLPLDKLLSHNIIERYYRNLTSNYLNNQVYGLVQDSSTTTSSSNQIKDFMLTATDHSYPITKVLFVTWLLGIMIMLLINLNALIKVRKIKLSSQSITDTHILALFDNCKSKCNVKRQVRLCKSSCIDSPIMFRIRNVYILLPAKTLDSFTSQELEFILIHELIHCKSKDILINYFSNAILSLYWFHPLVWYVIKQMNLDREITCDNQVLMKFEDDKATEYGYTILNFVDSKKRTSTSKIISGIGGSKQQIKKRILKIASFHIDTKWMKFKSRIVVFLITLITITTIPFIRISVMSSDYYDFNTERDTSKTVIYKDLDDSFQGFDGSFVLYDTKADEYHIYNEKNSQTRISPYSTYKIYSGLFALEEGTITPQESTLAWNGSLYSYPEWNADHDLKSALRDSVSWYFQELDMRLGQSKLQQYLDRIQYGNRDISGGIKDFWIDSSLKISPIEQVKLLHSFYYNKFGFDQNNIDAIKDMLVIANTDELVFSGKTGTGSSTNGITNVSTRCGWFIGYLETPDNTYIFATNIQDQEEASGSKALEITTSILNDLYQNNDLSL